MIPEMKETLIILKNLAQGICESFVMKTIPSILIPFGAFLFGANSSQLVIALLALIAFDFLTGIFAAKVSGEAIKSRKVIRSAFKVAVYGLLVSAGHITETLVPGNFFIEEAVTTFLALTELISIIENAGKMGFAVPARLLNQLQAWRGETVVEEKRTGEPTRRDETVIPNHE